MELDINNLEDKSNQESQIEKSNLDMFLEKWQKKLD